MEQVETLLLTKIKKGDLLAEMMKATRRDE